MLRSIPLAFAVVVVVVVVAGCPAPAGGPTAEEGAAHTGLVAGTTLTYDIGNGLTETHEMKSSGVLFAGGIAVDVLAKQAGFAEDARTLTFGIDIEHVSIVRLLDCIARCGSLDAPIPFLTWPLEEGQSNEGEANVSVSELDGSTTLQLQRHTTIVSAPVEVVVAAGTFEAFPIAWSRTITDVAGAETVDSALLHLAPDVGVVKHQAFDGTVLDLTATP
ncbi:MAG: hypothetical protein Q8O67_30020 [Deltaproteobacteria bacterium]|nr:hypothetical protein [Deltaproteobacteria bacterium]